MSEPQSESDVVLRLAALEERVENMEDHTEALALIPERTADLRNVVDDTRAAVRGVRHELDGLRELITQRFNRVDQAHDRANGPHGIDWKTLITFAATVVVPIVVTIIATKG